MPADVPLPTLYDGIEMSEAKMDNSLPPQSIQAFVSKDSNGKGETYYRPLTDELVKSLVTKSEARRAAEPGFAKVIAKIAELKDKKPVKLADLRQKTKGKGEDKDNDEAKQLEQVVQNEAVNIAADVISLGRM